jgi:hypothetical protein
MTPAVAATQETPMKRGEKRSPSGHAASAITMKNNAGTMKHADMPVLFPRVDAGARKNPVRCPARASCAALDDADFVQDSVTQVNNYRGPSAASGVQFRRPRDTVTAPMD